MEQLISDILVLSRVIPAELKAQTVNLSVAASEIADRLKSNSPSRRVHFDIAPGIDAWGDGNLLGLVLQNLLDNAFKFSRSRETARIEFGTRQASGKKVYFVRDNGVGFDMQYCDKLFKPFQRLHSDREFPGTGVGLATAQKIIRRHGGDIWAEGEVERGATFYFTLGGQTVS